MTVLKVSHTSSRQAGQKLYHKKGIDYPMNGKFRKNQIIYIHGPVWHLLKQ